MLKRKHFNRASILIFALMGCFFAANQNLVNNISVSLGANQTQMGNMISALYFGCVIAVLFFGELAQRKGKRFAAIITAGIVSTGALIITLSNSIPAVTAGFFVYGIGSAGYESCAMALVAEHNGKNANRSLNLTQAVFSVGAVITPILLSLVLKQDEFRPAYAIITCCYLSFALYWLFMRGIGEAQPQEQQHGAAILNLVKSPYMLLYMLVMIIFVGSETAVTYWIGSYFTGQGIGQLGAFALSAYWFASIFGRVLGSLVKTPSLMMPYYFSLAALGCLLLTLLPGAALKIAAVVLVGLAFAPVYGSVAFLAAERFPEASAASLSLIVFSSGVGGMVFQPAISHFLTIGEPRSLYVIIAVLSFCAALIMAQMHRLDKKRAANAQ